jgi:hypothetical protein
VAAGRPGGYFHVNWNGDVSPCVFCPWSPVNLRDVYEAGGTLDDVWGHPFFAAIRRWQREYGYRESHEPRGETHDWIAPCLIRDHHADFERLVAPGGVLPTDADARAAQDDPAWHEGLKQFDREFQALADPVWERVYLRSPGVPPGPMRRY